MPDLTERVGIVEALQKTHNERHEREWNTLQEDFRCLNQKMGHVHARLDYLAEKVGNPHNPGNPTRRNTIIHIGIPAAGGGAGFIALAAWVLERIVGG